MSAAYPLRESITIDHARECILAASPRTSRTQVVKLSEALNRTLAIDVAAACPLPNYTNSAMDGYALRFADIAGKDRVTLSCVDSSFAGAPCRKEHFEADVCIEITTGAAVPKAFDTVIAFEKCDINEAARTVTFNTSAIRAGANIRHQGEQVQPGQVILHRGVHIKAQHIALLAAAGVAEVRVYDAINVALLTTGSELIEPGKPLGPYQIYNSNGIMLKSQLEALGCNVQSACIDDSAQNIAEQIVQAAARCDMLILTGGAGEGRFDLSQAQLGTLGSMQPWSINMRPGRPMRFGTIASKPAFVLPGNPVAAFVTFLEFVRGALLQMQGRSEAPWLAESPAVLSGEIRKKPGRAEFARARIVGYKNNLPVVEPMHSQSSADLVTLAQSDVIVCLDHDCGHCSEGDIVQIQYLREAAL